MNLINGLSQILVFQGLGELTAKFVLPILPGPVFGLIFLLVFCIIRGRTSDSLDFVADGFAQHLGILFVPAAVGVILFVPQLRSHGLVLLLTLALSVALTIIVSALVLRWFPSRNQTNRKVRGDQ